MRLATALLLTFLPWAAAPVLASDPAANARALVQPHVVSILVVREAFNQSERSLELSSGSGAVIDAAGHIATNAHVVERGQRFKVVRSDGRELSARLVGSDLMSDLAVLKLDQPGPHGYAPFVDQLELKAGDPVYALGAPWGLVDSLSAGVVNKTERLLVSLFEDEADYEGEVSRDQPTARYYAWIQHDAAISPGNSGGPLVDSRGRVVGVNTRGSFFGGDMAFAIPAPIAGRIVAGLIRDGRMIRSDHGFSVRSLKRTPHRRGALINSVERGSPADLAGLEAGDLILEVDDETIALSEPTDVPPFRLALADRPVGSRLKLKIQRDGRARTVELTSRELEVPLVDELELPNLGLSVRLLSATERRNRLLDDGSVLVTGVRPGGPAAIAQPPLQTDDVLVSIEQKELSQLAQLRPYAAVDAAAGRKLRIEVARRGQRLLAVLETAPKRRLPEQTPELVKSWAGFEVQPITQPLAQGVGLGGAGFRITRLYPDSPASRAGLRVGDLITATSGVAVRPNGLTDSTVFEQRVRNAPLDQPLELSYERDGKSRQAKLKLVAEPIRQELAERGWLDAIGVLVRALTYYDRANLKLDREQEGVVIERVERGGYGGLAFLQSGDLLRSINGVAIGDVRDAQKLLGRLAEQEPQTLSFLVRRAGQTRLLYGSAPWTEGVKDDAPQQPAGSEASE